MRGRIELKRTLAKGMRFIGGRFQAKSLEKARGMVSFNSGNFY
jgi:hypothetical protein